MKALRKQSPHNTQDALRIVDEINRLQQEDLDRLGIWQDLALISSRTAFESVDCDPSSVVLDIDQRFEAIASVYVKLVYGPKNDEETLSDEYLATFQGVLTADKVQIESAAIDVSSFYE